jgi:hypothetical protein
MHSAVVLSLEKAALQSIRTQLLLLQKKTLDHHDSSATEADLENGDLYDNELNAIKFEHFALTLLNHMNSMVKIEKKLLNNQLYTQTTSFYLQIASIISVFDSVDVDSRGVIAFNDFVDFCLRLGRLLLKPSIKTSFSTYLQFEGGAGAGFSSKGALYPSHKIRYFPTLNTLFVMDMDIPRVRMYKGRDGKYLDKCLPVTEAKKLLKHQSVQKTTYYEKSQYDKESNNLKATERELDDSKGNILDCCYIDHMKTIIFSSSHGYLFYMDCSYGFKDTFLHAVVPSSSSSSGNLGSTSKKGEDLYKIQHFVKSLYPLYGLLYSSVLDMVVGYPGEGSENTFEIYDPTTRQLKYQIKKHESKILSLCEVILDKAHPMKDHYFVSSSIDKKVIMWPTAVMSQMIQNSSTAKRLLRVADIIDYELRGHNHAISCLVYAKSNEILFGCGFDYEIIGWDPFSRDICMKFIGHFKSLISLQIAYIPEEKLLSLDDSGVLKVWNINKDLGVYGNQESSVTLLCTQPPNIKDFATTYETGKGIAILAEKVYYLNIETSDLADELKPLSGGIGICPTAGRLWTIFRSTIHLYDICNSKKIKKIPFLDPDRISSADELVSNLKHGNSSSGTDGDVANGTELKMVEPIKRPASASHKKNDDIPHSHKKKDDKDITNVKYFSRIDIKDTITAITTDCHGKKVFLGTRDGRILLFDSFTFGLLKQLTHELEDNAFSQQGAVVGLEYINRDELLVAVYDNGAVKIYSGCLRSAIIDESTASSSSSDSVPEKKTSTAVPFSSSSSSSHHNEEEGGSGFMNSFFGCPGGKAPPKQSLLRESDLGFIQDHSIKSLAVSVDHNIVATLSKTGLIFIYDYLTLEFITCFSMEDDSPSSATASGHHHTSTTLNKEEETISYLFLEFLPSIPVLLVVDTSHRITAWGCKGMGYRYLLAWNIYDDIHYNNDKATNSFYDYFDFHGANPVSMSLPTFANQLNPQISCMKSYSYYDPKRSFTTVVTSSSAIVTNSRVSFSLDFSPSTPSPARNKNVSNSSTAAGSSVDQRWILLLTTEDGLVLTQNLTPLIEKTGALDFLVKIDSNIHYPVYNRIKSKRYKLPNISNHDYHTDYPRIKLPEEWQMKLFYPLKRYSSIENNPLMESLLGPAYSQSISMSFSALSPDAPPTRQGSSLATSGLKNAIKYALAAVNGEPEEKPHVTMMFGKVPHLTKQPTATAQTRKQMRNYQRMLKRLKLEDKISTYIEGLYTWHAFTRQSIKGIQFYNPYLDYNLISNDYQKLFSMSSSSSSSSSNHNNDNSILFSRLSYQIPYEISTQVDRLPLIGMLGENGNIRFWTFTGVYLGQNIDDENDKISHDESGGERWIPEGENEDEDPNKIEEDLYDEENNKKVKTNMFSEIFSEENLKASTTFVTSLEETDETDPHSSFSSLSKSNALKLGIKKSSEEASLAPKVYVINERTSRISTKRLSVIAKDTSFGSTSSFSSRSSSLLSNKKGSSPASGSKKFIPFSKDHLVTNPKMKSTMIIQSFLNYNNSLNTGSNAYDNYPIECNKLFRKKYGSIGWDFPCLILNLPLQLTAKDSDVFPVYNGSMLRFSFIQYKFYLRIIIQLLKIIQNDINALYLDKIGFFDESNLTRNREEIFKMFLKSSQPPKLFRKISTYANRFHSMENLLKGIDTYLMKASVEHRKNLQLLTTKHRKPPKYPMTEEEEEETTEEMKKQENEKKELLEKKKIEIENLLLYSSYNDKNKLGNSSQSIYDSNYHENKKNEQLLKYIISGLTEHELMMANALQKKNISKQSKYNLNNLIDYIQDNSYFSNDLKAKSSQSLKFSNYEKERLRKQQASSSIGSDDHFEKRLKELRIDPKEFLAMKKRKGDKGKPPLNPAGKGTMTSSSSSQIVSVTVNNLTGIDEEEDLDKIISNKIKEFHAMKEHQAKHQDSNNSEIQERPSTAPASLNRSSPTTAFTRHLLASSPPSLLKYQKTAIVKAFTSSPSSPAVSRPLSPVNNRPYSASDMIFRHTSVAVDDDELKNDPVARRKLLTSQKLDKIIENLETISLTGIQCENSETFPIASSINDIIEKSKDNPQLSTALNSRPLSATHQGQPHLSMFIDHSTDNQPIIFQGSYSSATGTPSGDSLDLGGLNQSRRNSNNNNPRHSPGITLHPLTIPSTSSYDLQQPKHQQQSESKEQQPNRLLQISQKYEEAILDSKLFSQSFHVFTPGHSNSKNHNEKGKYSKKLKRKLYLSRHRDQYLDETNLDEEEEGGGGNGDNTNNAAGASSLKLFTEDIIDMEKEYKLAEKKRLYIQATAAGEKSTYGFYRVLDIFQFMSLLDLLTSIDLTKDSYLSSLLNSDKSTKLFYFNENGIDFSKIVVNQPFYFIEEVLTLIMDFFNYEENALISELKFYRDDVPKLPIISLYHLIEIFFSQTKNVNFHLRVFMFINGANLISELFRNAMPPKEFNKIKGNGSPGRPRSRSRGSSEDERETKEFLNSPSNRLSTPKHGIFARRKSKYNESKGSKENNALKRSSSKAAQSR